MNTLWRETRHALSGPTSADRISAWSGHQVHRRPIGLGQSQYQKSSVVTFVSIAAKTFRRDPGI